MAVESSVGQDILFSMCAVLKYGSVSTNMSRLSLTSAANEVR